MTTTVRFLLVLSIFLIGVRTAFSQHRFLVGVSKVGDTKVRIEWKNPYGDSVVQLNVQRSWDSVKNFRTVFVPLSPELPQNGYVEESFGYPGFYYRVFYVLSDGSFFFTPGKRAISGSDFTNGITEEQQADSNFLV